MYNRNLKNTIRMLENWLSEISLDPTMEKGQQPWQLGSNLRKNTGGAFPDLRDVQAAIIGIGQEDADAVREALYPLACPQGKFQIADLGNFRKNNLSFIVPALTELLQSHILPIVIGNDFYFSLTLYKAAQQLLRQINLVTVDETLRFRPEMGSTPAALFDQLVHDPGAQLFHLSIIGFQSHFTEPAALHTASDRLFDGVRLGQVRANLQETEPIVRDGDICCFNLAALKQSEAPGQVCPSPGGLTMEEACQICRYAGLSDKLKAFGIFGFRQDFDRQGQTAQTTAQMIWYFLEGLLQRKGDFPASLDGLTEYIVERKSYDPPLKFWKSRRSGRWWVQVSTPSAEAGPVQQRLVPCSHNDYLAACQQDELPERILNILKRFG